MKLTTLFAACLFLLAMTAYAQDTNDSLYVRRKPEPPKKKWTERLSPGGNFGLSFGNPTSINLSPLLGYRITDKFIAGGGVTYIYSRSKGYNPYAGANVTYTSNVTGGRAFAQHSVGFIENLAVRGEFEYLTLRNKFSVGGYEEQFTESVSNPMAGLAYIIPLGRRASFNIIALYNFNYSDRNANRYLYGSPFVFRMGFSL